MRPGRALPLLAGSLTFYAIVNMLEVITRENSMNRAVRLLGSLGFVCLLLCGSLQAAYGQTSVFGPQVYARNSGRPQPVAAQFSVANPSGDYTLVVRNGGAQEGRVSSALVKLNGAVVVDPSEFNQQVKRIEKRVSLQAQNEIAVELRSAPGTSVEITILGTSTTSSTTEVISPAGGTITLGGIAVLFPSGVFPAETLVTLSLTSSEETREDFDVTAEIFSPGPRLPFEIRINSGLTPPATPIKAVVDLPDSFLSSLPSDGEVQAFAQVFENGGEETLDSFEIFPSSVDPTAKVLSVELPVEVFTAEREIDPSYEAVVIIGSTPTKPASATGTSRLTGSGIVQGGFGVKDSSVSSAAGFLALEATECKGSSLGAPLEGDLKVNSPFDGKAHYGTDYAAANGNNVLAAADGKVFKIGFDARPLPKPDPRSGKTVKGWGTYIVIEHADGSKTLYAHLESTEVAAGSTVTKGSVIAKSDNSGGSSGPHLHMEYAPNGKIFDRSSKVDPNACIARDGMCQSDADCSDQPAPYNQCVNAHCGNASCPAPPPASSACIPAGSADDILYNTNCCSGSSVPGSACCIYELDWGSTWASCTQICA